MGYETDLKARYAANRQRLRGARPAPVAPVGVVEPIVPSAPINPVAPVEQIPEEVWPIELLQAPTPLKVLRIAAKFFNVRVIDIISERRTAYIILPRHVAIYVCCILTTRSLPAIGRAFGGRDHTSILHAKRKITNRLLKDEGLKMKVEQLIKLIEPHKDRKGSFYI